MKTPSAYRTELRRPACAQWIFLALLIFSVAPARAADATSEDACRAHLKRIGGAIRAYRLIHENKFPAKLADLYLDGLVENLGDFTCPASGTFITSSAELDAKSDYTLESVPGTTNLLAREKNSRHGQNIVLAVFADGSIKPVAVAVAPVTTVNQPPAAPPSILPPAPVTVSAPALDVAAAVQKGRELVQARRLPEALELFRRASQSQPDDPTAAMNRASLELAIGDVQAAFDLSQSLLKRNPRSGPAHSLAGLVAHCRGDAAAARLLFAQAVTLDPQLPDNHYQQATAYNRNLVSALALQHYAVAAMLDPRRYYVSHYYMGKIYETSFMPAAGIAEFEAYLRSDATSQWAGQARQAIQGMRTVLKDAPTASLRAIPTSP